MKPFLVFTSLWGREDTRGYATILNFIAAVGEQQDGTSCAEISPHVGKVATQPLPLVIPKAGTKAICAHMWAPSVDSGRLSFYCHGGPEGRSGFVPFTLSSLALGTPR